MTLSRSLRRWIAALLALALLAPGTALAAQPVTPETDDRYYVEFTVSAEQGAGIARAAGGRVVHRFDAQNLIAAALPAQALQALQRNPNVRAVQADPRRYPVNTVSGNQTTPYGITMVQADQVTSGTAIPRVCIIDSGYALGHEDLPGTNVTFTTNTRPRDPSYDGHGHGTHVAGTIAALGGNNLGVVGVLRNGAPLHIVKVFNNGGTWAYSSDLVDAANRCEKSGAKVINMSLGGGGPSAYEQNGFAAIYAKGVISVAAAGNSGNTAFLYPASYDTVISVAAVDATRTVASFSQKNSQVELAAPGVNVLSTLPNNTYASWSGTSMATPHVAGVAALVWSHYPGKTNGEIRQVLRETAQDLGSPGRDDAYGHGLVQAHAALAKLGGPTSGDSGGGGSTSPGNGKGKK